MHGTPLDTRRSSRSTHEIISRAMVSPCVAGILSGQVTGRCLLPERLCTHISCFLAGRPSKSVWRPPRECGITIAERWRIVGWRCSVGWTPRGQAGGLGVVAPFVPVLDYIRWVLWIRWWTFAIHKRRINVWGGERLSTSQEWLCSIELVNLFWQLF